MARLSQQRAMVKWLDDFFAKTGYSGGSATYSYRINNINQGGVPKGDFLLSYQTRMSWRDWFVWIFRKNYFSSQKYQLDRMSKIENLFRSCLGEGFIEPVANIDIVDIKDTDYLRVSNRLGSDLIHWVGFWERVMEKYPTQKLIVYTIIGSVFSTSVLIWILNKFFF